MLHFVSQSVGCQMEVGDSRAVVLRCARHQSTQEAVRHRGVFMLSVLHREGVVVIRLSFTDAVRGVETLNVLARL